MTTLTLEHIVSRAFEAVRPTTHMSVCEAGEKYVTVEPSALHRGKWSRKLTPYLVEPQNDMTSLDYTGLIFAGPARIGKSAPLMNFLAYTALVDPTDVMLLHHSQNEARNWSKGDLAKFLRRSPEIKAELIPGQKYDNTYDKDLISGTRWMITWPTIGNLSGKTVPRHWILDYDRLAQDVDGEGNPFDLIKKRGETYLRLAMTVAESSPGFSITDPKWQRTSPHEAPPTDGILKLYNRGTRKWYYWECVQCQHHFSPDNTMFDFPGKKKPSEVFHDIMDAAEQVTLVCPECSFPHEHSMKSHLNEEGKWVPDNMIWTPDNRIVPLNGRKPIKSDISSYWLKGPCAAFQSWKNMVAAYLQAEKEYASTGDEKALRKHYNTDRGEPYVPKAMVSERSPERLKDRAENWGSVEGDITVPADVRFLIATVDVQAGAGASFVVQVHGITPSVDIIVIDMFKISKSKRLDQDGDPLPLDPAAYPEDWDVLIDQVIKKSYKLSDQSGRRMEILITACDSGGAEGVTLNAYDFWRRCREKGLHRQFQLIKGGSVENSPTTRVIIPDSNAKNKFSGAVGDVPVILLNPWVLKDQISNMLMRRIKSQVGDQTGGMVRYPDWVPGWFYEQITTEIRSKKGWENPRRRRNEAWDLLYYTLGVIVRPYDMVYNTPFVTVNIDKIDWNNPPEWAREWDRNSLVTHPDSHRNALSTQTKKLSLGDLGKELA